MKPLLVINQDRWVPGQAPPEGYDIIWTYGEDVPAVQMVHTKADRRFGAACAALTGILADKGGTRYHSEGGVIRASICAADMLLAELDKPT